MRKNDWILTIIWCVVIIAGLGFMVFMTYRFMICSQKKKKLMLNSIYGYMAGGANDAL